MTDWSLQRFYIQGMQNDINVEILDSVIAHAKNISSNGGRLTPIFTLNHLAYLSNVSYCYLLDIVKRDAINPYRIFYIRKRKNKKQVYVNRRQICVPDYQLLAVQRFIHHNILKHIPSHYLCFSYSSSSIYDAASLHCSCRWLIKIDIQSFFESISEISVYRIFRRAGYPSLLSFQLARICTRQGLLHYPINTERWEIYKRQRYKIFNNVEGLGYLPQGAPTSPVLSNLVCSQLDNELEILAKKANVVYSRYADDLTFSTINRNFTRADAKIVVTSVFNIIRNFGFSPNYSKTTIVPPGARKIVLGLSVDTNKVKLSNSFKKNIKTHIHFCKNKKIGPTKHAKARKFASVIGFKNHLSGLIAYAIQIESIFGLKMLKEFKEIEWPFT